jgi:hypothetical protein
MPVIEGYAVTCNRRLVMNKGHRNKIEGMTLNHSIEFHPEKVGTGGITEEAGLNYLFMQPETNKRIEMKENLSWKLQPYFS